MPFVSDRDQRTLQQNLTPYVDVPEYSFYETFGASVGRVIDEELSISMSLSREGWADRRRKVTKLIGDGKVDRQQYLDRRGRFDYDRLASDLNDPDIKTDQQLEQERNALLAQRRTYSDRVLANGSGTAQFLGAATAYMLDPINIALMPVATANVASKSMSVAGRALLTARNEAMLATAAELAIQPLVYTHKHDIGSPYSESDAIKAIGFAAAGAFAIGGAIVGISGYVSKVRKSTEDLIEVEPEKFTPQLERSVENLKRLEEKLKTAPDVDLAKIEQDFVEELKADLLAQMSQKVSRGERKVIEQQIKNLEQRKKNVSVDPEEVTATPSVSKRRAKIEAQKQAKAMEDEMRLDIDTQIDSLKNRLAQGEIGRAAEANLSRLEQGIIPDDYQPKLKQIQNDALIENESQYLEMLDNYREQLAEPTKTPEIYEPMPVENQSKPTSKTAKGRQKEVLKNTGFDRSYDEAMANFEALENPRLFTPDGDEVDARKIMADADEQLDAMDEVLVCAYG